jgi:5-oxoprolinase (ATP-hydrolysing)
LIFYILTFSIFSTAIIVEAWSATPAASAFQTTTRTPRIIKQQLTSVKTRTTTTTTTISIRMMSDCETTAKNKYQFSIDRGGTFTDIHCILPCGKEIVTKLLSEDPDNYPDAPTEGIRRILYQYDNNGNNDDETEDEAKKKTKYLRDQKVDTTKIQSIRMGTTVATNALLERRGEKTGLIITKGFQDLLEIGNQSRSDIFDLSCYKPTLLYEHVEEVDERIILAEFVTNDDNDDSSDNNSNDDNNDNDDDDTSVIYQKNTCLSVLAKTLPRATGITNEEIIILKKPQTTQIQQILQSFKSKNIKSIAIVLTHSYTYDKHEVYIASLAQSMNWFTNISLSSHIMPMIKMVSRGHTACAAAYLTPKIMTYLTSFKEGFDDELMTNVRLSFMKSDGGLTPVDDFGGHQAILSGPAGGVVGYAKTAYRKEGGLIKGNGTCECGELAEIGDDNDDATIMPVIGFDMGGTSTDVSRYDGTLELVFETTTAGVAIQAPQLEINTVAAGGGSRLFLRSGMFYVGPESAGKQRVSCIILLLI